MGELAWSGMILEKCMHKRIRWMGKRRRGNSLVEAILAVMILAIAVPMFAASFPASSLAILRDRHADVATNACAEQNEFWRNVGYSSLPAITGSSLTQSFTPPSGLVNPSASVTFTRVDDSLQVSTTDTGRVRVTSTITWTGRGSDQGTVSLTTLLAR